MSFGTCYGTDGAEWSCTIMTMAAGSEASCSEVQPGFAQLTTQPFGVPCAYIDAFRQQMGVQIDVHRVAGCEGYVATTSYTVSGASSGTGDTGYQPPVPIWMPDGDSHCFPC